MATAARPTEPNLEVLKSLAEGLLHSAGRARVSGRYLEIHHPAAPLFDPDFLHSPQQAHGISISLCQDGEPCPQHPLRCNADELPFQDHVFDMVLLHHVIAGGEEAELGEAARVLARNGVLLLLGLNRMGWRYRSQDACRRLPGLAPFRVRTCLQRLGLEMQGFAGAGLAGRNGPAFMHSGLPGLAVPLADLVLLQARHRHSAGVTPLRFGKPRGSVVQSAPMRG